MSDASKQSIAIGCLVGVISSATQAVGITLQRKSHILESDRPQGSHRRSALRSPMWRLGLFLFLLANIVGSSVQITALPLIILSPLQAIGLVFNSICATVLLHEPFTGLSILGTILVSVGALLIAIFGAIPEPQHNLDELLELLGRRPLLVWMVMTGVVVCLVAATIRWLSNNAGTRISSLGLSVHTVRGALYGVISGILSAHSLLMAKSAVELAVRGFRDKQWDDYVRWQTWLIIAAFLTFALSQLYVLNCGMRLCSTSLLYPLVFCVYNIVTIINGLVYFNQASKLSVGQILLLVQGTVLVLLGVLCLSLRLEEHTPTQFNRKPSLRHPLYLSRDHDRERQPLVIDTRTSHINYSSTDQESPRYTSFRSLSGSSPAFHYEPISPFSATPRHGRTRTLSLEQAEILDQLRQNANTNNG